MQLFLILLASLITSITSSILPKRDYGLAYAPAPGPIPYLNPADYWPAEQSVTPNRKHLGLTVPVQNMTDCLTEYSTGQFYDSWQGNVCAGMGWFKGPPDSSISTYDCYQTCATWLMYDGIKYGASDYQCDFEKGTSGHCWMGYHPLEPSSTLTVAAPALATLGIATS